jgi:hypothetical protein
LRANAPCPIAAIEPTPSATPPPLTLSTSSAVKSRIVRFVTTSSAVKPRIVSLITHLAFLLRLAARCSHFSVHRIQISYRDACIVPWRICPVCDGHHHLLFLFYHYRARCIFNKMKFS